MCRIASLLLAVILFVSCSTHVVYNPHATHAAANAININSATADDLEQLPHIGRKTAGAIVEFRTKNGPFRRIEHVMQIRGVSEERFLEIRHLLRIE